jgi:thioesterase domain-containing protein
MVAFEMARQLQAHGEQVGLLAVLDVAATPGLMSVGDDDQAAFLIRFVESLGIPGDHLTDGFWQRGAGERMTWVLEQARIGNLVPPDLDLAQLERYLRVFTANMRAMQTYTPQPYAGRLALFRAGDMAGIAPDDATLGWDRLAT